MLLGGIYFLKQIFVYSIIVVPDFSTLYQSANFPGIIKILSGFTIYS